MLDTIVHFAEKPHVDFSITGSDTFIKNYIIEIYSLLKADKKAWLEISNHSTITLFSQFQTAHSEFQKTS